jgi:ferredoxin-nitrate reductase
LIAEAPLGLAEPPDEAYPLVLTVGRYLAHWHTLTRTVHVERARQRHPGPMLEVHPSDAAAFGLVDGAIARVASRRGGVRVPVRLTETIRPGVVFLPMHWGASQPEACEANRLMHELGCPLSRQPELKAAAVRLEPG